MNRNSSFGELKSLSFADHFRRYLSTRKTQSVFSQHSIRVAVNKRCDNEVNIARLLIKFRVITAKKEIGFESKR
jgi:hypothetical protein